MRYSHLKVRVHCIFGFLSSLQLEELDISDNPFSGDLNPNIARLGQLKKLVLASCKLTSLPDWIENLKQVSNDGPVLVASS